MARRHQDDPRDVERHDAGERVVHAVDEMAVRVRGARVGGELDERAHRMQPALETREQGVSLSTDHGRLERVLHRADQRRRLPGLCNVKIDAAVFDRVQHHFPLRGTVQQDRVQLELELPCLRNEHQPARSGDVVVGEQHVDRAGTQHLERLVGRARQRDLEASLEPGSICQGPAQRLSALSIVVGDEHQRAPGACC